MPTPAATPGSQLRVTTSTDGAASNSKSRTKKKIVVDGLSQSGSNAKIKVSTSKAKRRVGFAPTTVEPQKESKDPLQRLMSKKGSDADLRRGKSCVIDLLNAHQVSRAVKPMPALDEVEDSGLADSHYLLAFLLKFQDFQVIGEIARVIEDTVLGLETAADIGAGFHGEFQQLIDDEASLHENMVCILSALLLKLKNPERLDELLAVIKTNFSELSASDEEYDMEAAINAAKISVEEVLAEIESEKVPLKDALLESGLNDTLAQRVCDQIYNDEHNWIFNTEFESLDQVKKTIEMLIGKDLPINEEVLQLRLTQWQGGSPSSADAHDSITWQSYKSGTETFTTSDTPLTEEQKSDLAQMLKGRDEIEAEIAVLEEGIASELESINSKKDEELEKLEAEKAELERQLFENKESSEAKRKSYMESVKEWEGQDLKQAKANDQGFKQDLAQLTIEYKAFYNSKEVCELYEMNDQTKPEFACTPKHKKACFKTISINLENINGMKRTLEHLTDNEERSDEEQAEFEMLTKKIPEFERKAEFLRGQMESLEPRFESLSRYNKLCASLKDLTEPTKSLEELGITLSEDNIAKLAAFEDLRMEIAQLTDSAELELKLQENSRMQRELTEQATQQIEKLQENQKALRTQLDRINLWDRLSESEQDTQREDNPDLSVTSFSTIGKRSDQEDTHLSFRTENGIEVHMVNDGHGGRGTSTYLKENAQAFFEAHLSTWTQETSDEQTRHIIQNAYYKLNQKLSTETLRGGSTHIAMFKFPEKNIAIIANIGDTEAVDMDNYQTLVAPQNPTDQSVQHEVRLFSNGSIQYHEPSKHFMLPDSSQIGVGRHLGSDKEDPLNGLPEITQLDLTQTGPISLRCDGLAEGPEKLGLHSTQVNKFCHVQTNEEAAKVSFLLGSRDNMSALQVDY